jgi:hypothetical protein
MRYTTWKSVDRRKMLRQLESLWKYIVHVLLVVMIGAPTDSSGTYRRRTWVAALSAGPCQRVPISRCAGCCRSRQPTGSSRGDSWRGEDTCPLSPCSGCWTWAGRSGPGQGSVGTWTHVPIWTRLWSCEDSFVLIWAGENIGTCGKDGMEASGFITCTYPNIVSSPATRHGGGWEERRYSSYSFTTSALDGGE